MVNSNWPSESWNWTDEDEQIEETPEESRRKVAALRPLMERAQAELEKKAPEREVDDGDLWASVIAENPGLTREEAEEMARSLGF